MSQALLLLNATVYSPVNSFATALLAHAGTVEWVGQDTGASSIRDNSMQVITLKEQLVAPAFALAGLAVKHEPHLQQRLKDLKKNGYAALTLFTEAESVSTVNQQTTSAGFKTYIYASFSSPEAITVSDSLHGVLIDPIEPTAQNSVDAALAQKLKVSFLGNTPARIRAALEIVGNYQGLAKLRAGFRLDGVTRISQENLLQSLEHSIALGFSSHLDDDDDSLHRAIAAGAPVALGSDPTGAAAAYGWELTRNAVVRARETDQISARAAFNAMSRGVYRAAGSTTPAAGQIAPGAPADFTVWEAENLTVQTGNSQTVSFAQDPRGRTSLLPQLGEEALPRLLTLYIDGQKTFS